jgi:hypothetical protein
VKDPSALDARFGTLSALAVCIACTDDVSLSMRLCPKLVVYTFGALYVGVVCPYMPAEVGYLGRSFSLLRCEKYPELGLDGADMSKELRAPLRFPSIACHKFSFVVPYQSHR